MSEDDGEAEGRRIRRGGGTWKSVVEADGKRAAGETRKCRAERSQRVDRPRSWRPEVQPGTQPHAELVEGKVELTSRTELVAGAEASRGAERHQ